jgi:hypothetical protein
MTMTRETKVGLVVCLSFLCLVGVVLGTKLRGDGAEEEQPVKEEIIPDSQLLVSTQHDLSPTTRIPTQVPNAKGPSLMQTGAVQSAQPLPPPPTRASGQGQRMEVAPLPPPVSDFAEPITASQQDLSQSGPLSLDGVPGPQQPVSNSSNDEPGSHEPTTSGILVPTPLGMIRLPFSARSAGATPAVSTMPQNDSGPADVPPPAQASSSTASSDAKDKSVPVPSAVAPVSEPKQEAAATPPNRTEGLSSPPIARGANPVDVAPKSGAAESGSAQASKSGAIPLTMTPPPPASTASQPSAGLLPPIPPPDAMGTTDATGQAGHLQARATDAAPQQQAGASPQPIVPVSANDNPRRIGTTPTAVTPPIPVPAPVSAPTSRAAVLTPQQVDSYDEETYRLKPGDTFTKISTSHYNTDKYAKALERWNVNHPQATESMRADPPQLEPGQPIYIPPAYMLEKRHGSVIPGYKKQADPTPNEAPRTANASPRAGAVDKSSPDHRWYQVGPRGESMLDIARNTLGKAERWTEISKLNPTIDPAYPVRAGLLIKVPPDAKSPAVGAPPDSQRQP